MVCDVQLCVSTGGYGEWFLQFVIPPQHTHILAQTHIHTQEHIPWIHAM